MRESHDYAGYVILGSRKRWLLAVVVLQAIFTGACRARTARAPASEIASFAPSEVRTLRSFGAVGDARHDDSAAIQRAFQRSDLYCLDGEGKSYRVSGTLRAERDLCFRNATLLQSIEPFDTRPFIRGACPVTTHASAVIDCGDPEIPPEQLTKLQRVLSVRTLLIRPGDEHDRIRVNLAHVKIDRGTHAEMGSRSDSAGIWLEGADRVDLKSVEITGQGKGYGILLIRSRNVNVANLWIHDLVWAPYPGDAPLIRDRVAKLGWNTVPIRELREHRPGGPATSKFYGVRIQEQVTCAYFAELRKVRIQNVSVEHCMARFDTGNLPWQADGLDIGRSSSDVKISRATVNSTWEGMDVVGGGTGIEGLSIEDSRVSNSFAFGLKLGYKLHNGRVANIEIEHAGIAGIVVYGAVGRLAISNAEIADPGTIQIEGREVSPWPGEATAGIRIDSGPGGPSGAERVPDDVLITNSTVTSLYAGRYKFGILNRGGTDVRIGDFRATGFSDARVRGVHPRTNMAPMDTTGPR
jgi:hypothetical protein